MAAAYMGIVFLTIVLLLAFHRSLYQAILGGVVMTVLLYRIPAAAVLHRTLRVFTDWGSCSVLMSLYLINFSGCWSAAVSSIWPSRI